MLNTCPTLFNQKIKSPTCLFAFGQGSEILPISFSIQSNYKSSFYVRLKSSNDLTNNKIPSPMNMVVFGQAYFGGEKLIQFIFHEIDNV